MSESCESSCPVKVLPAVALARDLFNDRGLGESIRTNFTNGDTGQAEGLGSESVQYVTMTFTSYTLSVH